jgi:ATP-dependent Clp protease ATP-binding subunit ClpX
MLEGSIVNVSVKAGTVIGKRIAQQGESFSIDTSNILFICSGAFIGLEKIVQDRINEKTSIGFESVIGEEERNEKLLHPLEHVVPEDLIKFGFIPEFIGRIPRYLGLGLIIVLLLQDH